MATTTLTEMEACILALIGSNGPLTAYALRRIFLASPSPQWSGSAGAIYPLIERLERRRLIRSRVRATGRRNGWLLHLTPQGRKSVRNWLAVELPDWVAGVPPDPLRTRIRFLAALSPAEQKKFLRSACTAVKRQLQNVIRDNEQKRSRGGYAYWMARGALLMMRARYAWLRELARLA